MKDILKNSAEHTGKQLRVSFIMRVQAGRIESKFRV